MKKTFLAGLIACTSMTMMAAPASAQGTPTIDMKGLIQTGKLVQNGVEQAKQLAEQTKKMGNIESVLGKVGVSQITSILDDIGIVGAKDDTLNQLKFAVPGILDSLPSSQTGSSLGIRPGDAAQARTSIQAGRNFALNAFYKSGNATNDEVTQRRGIRQAAMRDSLTAGYAMAVYAKNDINKSETVMKALSDRLAQSKDVRTDIQGNSAIALAQLRQMTIQNQLMAQMLEVQSTSAMADDGVGAGGQ